jgi:hypothetical protein
MANRYWVGGSGNWQDQAMWSETDGGTGGATFYAGLTSVDNGNNLGWLFEDVPSEGLSINLGYEKGIQIV